MSIRNVQRLLGENRIPGAVKHSCGWLIPVDCVKPADPRKSKRKTEEKCIYLPCINVSSIYPFAEGNTEKTLCKIEEASIKSQLTAEIAYLRGDFANILDYAKSVGKNDKTYICACNVAMAASISIADYESYTCFENKLYELIAAAEHSDNVLYAQVALFTSKNSMFAFEKAPGWLISGDASMFPLEMKPWVIYLHTKYLQYKKLPDMVLSAAKTALSFCARQGEFTSADLYLRLMCAYAYNALEQVQESKKELQKAANLALGCGFLTPLTETIPSYGGLLEQYLQSRYPLYYNEIIKRPQDLWKNWFAFHNLYTKENITLVLNLREYHLAQYLASGMSYAQAAKRMKLSVGRIKNLASSIYSKLYINGRNELSDFII